MASLAWQGPIYIILHPPDRYLVTRRMPDTDWERLIFVSYWAQGPDQPDCLADRQQPIGDPEAWLREHERRGFQFSAEAIYYPENYTSRLIFLPGQVWPFRLRDV